MSFYVLTALFHSAEISERLNRLFQMQDGFQFLREIKLGRKQKTINLSTLLTVYLI